MGDFVEVCLFLLTGCLALVTLFAAGVGIAGLVGGRIERCPACHHFDLSIGSPVHADGCPRHRWSAESVSDGIGSRHADRNWSGPLRHAIHH
jgi:hypothetical protein